MNQKQKSQDGDKNKSRPKSKSRSKSNLKTYQEFKISDNNKESNNLIIKLNENEDKIKTQIPKSILINSNSNQNSQIQTITDKNNIYENSSIYIEIDLKKPKNPFDFYVLEMQKTNNIKGNLADYTKILSEEYKYLPKRKIAEYEKLSKKDNKRYKSNIELVKKYKNDKLTNENINNSLISENIEEELDDKIKKDEKHYDKKILILL